MAALMVNHLGKFFGKSVDVVGSSSAQELPVGINKRRGRVKQGILEDGSSGARIELSGRI